MWFSQLDSNLKVQPTKNKTLCAQIDTTTIAITLNLKSISFCKQQFKCDFLLYLNI